MIAVLGLSVSMDMVVAGLTIGAVYGLIGLGFSVIYNASGILNFSQGAFVMLGGIFTYVFVVKQHMPMAVGVGLGVALVVLVGVLIQMLIAQPLMKRGASLSLVSIAMLGVSLLASNAVLVTLGSQAMGYRAFTAGPSVEVLGAPVTRQTFWILGSAVVLVAGLWVLLRRTHLGRAMRAIAYDAEIAQTMGVKPSRVLMVAFGLSALIGGMAGSVITAQQFTAYNVGLPFAIKGFVASVIGGFENPFGAIIGGLILGLFEAFAIMNFSTTFADAIVYGSLIIVLIIRPGEASRSLGIASKESQCCCQAVIVMFAGGSV